jgi:hypothetical protein
MQGGLAVPSGARRALRLGLLSALLGSAATCVSAQGISVNELPQAPGFVAAALSTASGQDQGATATMIGTVLDVDGAQLPGAQVVLENQRTHEKQTVRSGEDGSFSVSGLPASIFQVTISADGFAPQTLAGLETHAGESLQVPVIALEVASLATTVDAITQYQMAEIEVHQEEKQRVLGVVPNFYVVYNWHAAALTPGQKFRLAMRAEVDPFAFLGAGISAGIEQAANTFSGYGQGGSGFAKRFGAAYADGFTGTLIGGAILPSLLHQDPRYYYKGTGTIKARALYAISTVVICKGDNGRWQPNYSSIVGDLAAAGISNAYYPATDRHGAGLVIGNALIGTAGGAFSSLMQEFVLRHIMGNSAVRPQSAVPTKFLPE